MRLAFDAVVRHGSVTLAAAELHPTQSTVRRLMRAAEGRRAQGLPQAPALLPAAVLHTVPVGHGWLAEQSRAQPTSTPPQRPLSHWLLSPHFAPNAPFLVVEPDELELELEVVPEEPLEPDDAPAPPLSESSLPSSADGELGAGVFDPWVVSEHGEAGRRAAEELTGEGLLAMWTGLERAALPLDWQAFNA